MRRGSVRRGSAGRFAGSPVRGPAARPAPVRRSGGGAGRGGSRRPPSTPSTRPLPAGARTRARRRRPREPLQLARLPFSTAAAGPRHRGPSYRPGRHAVGPHRSRVSSHAPTTACAPGARRRRHRGSPFANGTPTTHPASRATQHRPARPRPSTTCRPRPVRTVPGRRRRHRLGYRQHSLLFLLSRGVGGLSGGWGVLRVLLEPPVGSSGTQPTPVTATSGHANASPPRTT